MLLSTSTIFRIIPVIMFELFNRESVFSVKTNFITETLTLLKNHFSYHFKMLTCISGVDFPKNIYRFNVVYELLSLKYNSRVRFKVLVSELIPVDTIENIFAGATWYECEVWDMFGIFFLGQFNIRRLLTDYGFQGFPLRKDFPLTGFNESRFNHTKNKVGYEDLELAQEYRIFKLPSPWGDFIMN